jgi:crotonobetainyl-CoA:carnitine CoA-transferase CaiB-like acyl-CoA transferase
VLFNTQRLGKLSLGLDLKVAAAREILLRLAEASDILIANFTPGVLDRLGIGYDALSARNPQIVVVEMPAFGPGGPDSDHQGMGKTMKAACGMAALMGYGEGPPVLTGPAYLDPIGGLSAVGATLVALRHRDKTGTGCRVEVPQTEAGALPRPGARRARTDDPGHRRHQRRRRRCSRSPPRWPATSPRTSRPRRRP